MTEESPYRTPAVVETAEQRVDRCRRVYWAMAAVNVAGRTPDELKQIDDGFQRAAKAYRNALDALDAERQRR